MKLKLSGIDIQREIFDKNFWTATDCSKYLLFPKNVKDPMRAIQEKLLPKTFMTETQVKTWLRGAQGKDITLISLSVSRAAPMASVDFIETTILNVPTQPIHSRVSFEGEELDLCGVSGVYANSSVLVVQTRDWGRSFVISTM